MLQVKRPEIPKLVEILDFIDELENVEAKYNSNDRLCVTVRKGDTFYGYGEFSPFMRLPNEPILEFIRKAVSLIQ